MAAGLNHPTHREGKEAGTAQSERLSPASGFQAPASAPAAQRSASGAAARSLEQGDLLGAQVGEAHAAHRGETIQSATQASPRALRGQAEAGLHPSFSVLTDQKTPS